MEVPLLFSWDLFQYNLTEKLRFYRKNKRTKGSNIAMDDSSNLDKKDNFNKSDPFGLGILFWQKYVSNFLSIYNQFIQDTQRMNQVYRESAEITSEAQLRQPRWLEPVRLGGFV